MENESKPEDQAQEPVLQPAVFYDTNNLGTTPVPTAPTEYPTSTTPASPSPRSRTLGIVMVVLLFLTFFSPLGSALFLPILIVGVIFAANYVSQSERSRSTSQGEIGSATPIQQRSSASRAIYLVARIILIIGAIIGFGFLALIGLLFIAVASGGANFRMGS